MILLDAYALVALLGDEPPAAEVAALLDEGECAMTAVNLAEVVDVAGRTGRLEPGELRDLVGTLAVSGRLRVLTVGEDSVWRAGDLRGKHYANKSSELSLAACFLLGSAGPDDAIATADAPVARAARAEGIPIVALSSSSGRRPE